MGVLDAAPEKHVQYRAAAGEEQQHRDPCERFDRITVFRQHDDYYTEYREGISHHEHPVHPAVSEIF